MEARTRLTWDTVKKKRGRMGDEKEKKKLNLRAKVSDT